MTPKTKKGILIGSFVALTATIGYIAYRRSQNKKNSALFMQYIDSLPKMNTTGAINQLDNAAVADAKAQGSADIAATIKQYKIKSVILDGRVYPLSDMVSVKNAVSVAASIAKDLYEAMSGLGTNMLKFGIAFKRIGSNGGFALVNAVYKATYKEDLWKAIEGEESLFKGARTGWNAVVGKFMDIPNYAPEISSVVKTWKD